MNETPNRNTSNETPSTSRDDARKNNRPGTRCNKKKLTNKNQGLTSYSIDLTVPVNPMVVM